MAEFAAADGAISLDIQRRGGRELRVLQVLKLRGSGFRSGEHAYRISSAGIDVFPRLADQQDETGYKLSAERASTGVEALDKMLGDGYWEGSRTLICGPSGVGKTLMGLHFIFQGARTGQPGIHATFQETENQLARIAAGFGWSIDEPGVNILSRSLVDMYIDQWVYELLDLIEKTGAKRIVIDSLVDLMVTAGDPLRFREWMYSLVQRCARRGISLMMIVEVPELFQLRRISEEGISHLSDNVVLLQYVQDGSRLGARGHRAEDASGAPRTDRAPLRDFRPGPRPRRRDRRWSVRQASPLAGLTDGARPGVGVVDNAGRGAPPTAAWFGVAGILDAAANALAASRPRCPPWCHRSSAAADSRNVRAAPAGSRRSASSPSARSRCSAPQPQAQISREMPGAVAKAGRIAGLPRIALLVEDCARDLGVVGPRPPVEVVRADRRPHVVDHADLGVHVDRSSFRRFRRRRCRRGRRPRPAALSSPARGRPGSAI